jgi:hypothetical protein
MSGNSLSKTSQRSRKLSALSLFSSLCQGQLALYHRNRLRRVWTHALLWPAPASTKPPKPQPSMNFNHAHAVWSMLVALLRGSPVSRSNVSVAFSPTATFLCLHSWCMSKAVSLLLHSPRCAEEIASSCSIAKRRTGVLASKASVAVMESFALSQRCPIALPSFQAYPSRISVTTPSTEARSTVVFKFPLSCALCSCLWFRNDRACRWNGSALSTGPLQRRFGLCGATAGCSRFNCSRWRLSAIASESTVSRLIQPGSICARV